MTSCILRPDAAQHTGLGLQFCGQSGKLSAHDFEAQTMKPATDCFEAQTIKPAFDGFRAKPSNLLHTLQGVTHPRFWGQIDQTIWCWLVSDLPPSATMFLRSFTLPPHVTLLELPIAFLLNLLTLSLSLYTLALQYTTWLHADTLGRSIQACSR